MDLIILIVILLVVFGYPAHRWGSSRGWGYSPVGIHRLHHRHLASVQVRPMTPKEKQLLRRALIAVWEMFQSESKTEAIKHVDAVSDLTEENEK